MKHILTATAVALALGLATAGASAQYTGPSSIPAVTVKALQADGKDDQHAVLRGKRGRTLLFVNEFSAGANAGFYRRVLTSDGWNIVQDHALPTTGNRTAYVMTLRRGAAETSMSITRNGESTTVLVNFVDRN